jgi:hypothetical protein
LENGQNRDVHGCRTGWGLEYIIEEHGTASCND